MFRSLSRKVRPQRAQAGIWEAGGPRAPQHMARGVDTPMCVPVARDIGTSEHGNFGSEPARASAPRGTARGPPDSAHSRVAATARAIQRSRAEIASPKGAPHRAELRVAPSAVSRRMSPRWAASPRYPGPKFGKWARARVGGVGPVLARAEPHRYVATIKTWVGRPTCWSARSCAATGPPPCIRCAHIGLRAFVGNEAARGGGSFTPYFSWQRLPL